MLSFPERIKRLVQKLRFKKTFEGSPNLDKKLIISLKGTSSRIPTWSQFKRISLFLTSKEKRVVFILVGIIFVSIGTWSILFYRENIIRVPATGGAWSEALIGQPVFINPILAQTSDTDLDLSRLIFRGLLRYDEHLSLTTDLAERFSIDENQTKYTVVLKDNMFWQDGQPITVDDVIFTLQAIQDPEWKSPLLVSFKGVTVDKLDERTIAFNLPEPFSPFLSLLTTGILPKHIWEDIPATSARLAEFNTKPIGNGPWKFKEFAKDKVGTIHTYTLIPNSFYSEQPPYLTELTFKFYPDFSLALDALNQKQVLGMSFAPIELQQDIREQKNYSLHRLNLPQYTALFFNQKNNEFLKSKSVRTALAHAINKRELIEQGLQGHGNVIASPVLALETPDATTTLEFDPATSDRLLQDAGWKLNDLGYLEKDGTVLEIKLTTVNHPENQAVADSIKRYWEAIGVMTTVQLIPQTDIQATVIRNRDYDVLLYGAIVGADPDPYLFWHSSQVDPPGLNLSLFKDGNTDALLEDARKTADPEKRLTDYAAFRNILLEEVPAIFLYSPTYTYVQEHRLKGFMVDGLVIPADRFNNINTWFIKTKYSIK